MSLTNSEKSALSKAEFQRLVASISFTKPTNRRSECWVNYSQIYYENIPQDFS